MNRRPANVRRVTKAEKAAILQERADVQWLMSHPAGRRLVWTWLSKAHVFGPTFSTNTAEMSYREGRRALGTELLTMCLDHTPAEYLKMQKEHSTLAAELLTEIDEDDDGPE